MSEPLVAYVNLPDDPDHGMAIVVIPGEFATRIQGLYEVADLKEGKIQALNEAEVTYLLRLPISTHMGSIQITNNAVAVQAPDLPQETRDRLSCVTNHLECTTPVL